MQSCVYHLLNSPCFLSATPLGMSWDSGCAESLERLIMACQRDDCAVLKGGAFDRSQSWLALTEQR